MQMPFQESLLQDEVEDFLVEPNLAVAELSKDQKAKSKLQRFARTSYDFIELARFDQNIGVLGML